MPLRNVLTDPAARLVIGHRGAAAHAPENTLASFALAVEQGALALEMDVHLTRDGEVVVIHDPTIDRTTNATGAVMALTYAQVRHADAGARFTRDGGRSFPFRGTGIRVPRLAEVLDAFPGIALLVDAKSREVALPLRRLIERHHAASRVVVASFDRENLAPFRDAAIPTGATRHDVLVLLARTWLGLRPRRMRYAALSVPPSAGALRMPVAGFVAAARPLGRAVHVWTINDADRARALWAVGVNGIVTDDPAALREVLREALREARAAPPSARGA